MEKADIKSMNITELQQLLQEMGEPKFRAGQIFDWLHAKQVDSFDEMTNLSKHLRERLNETAAINGVEMVRRLVSQMDGTRKYLFALSDGAIIESVLMKYEHGNTVCISTQVGCRMGCKFCASTLDGVERGADGRRDAFPDLCDSKGLRRAGAWHGADGQWRAVG